MAMRSSNQVTPELLAVSEQTVAGLARRFLVDPFSENVGPDLSGLPADGLDALAHVAAALGVSIDAVQASSGELRSQVVELLVEVLKRSSLQDSRGKAAKEGLGDAGLLPAGQYSIRFNDLFGQFQALGERKAHVEEVMRAPHSVQHLSPKEEGGHTEGSSLFARSITPSKGKGFLQLVIANRQGSLLSFAGAWRIYADLVSWDTSENLMQVLEHFVAVYGIPFTVANSEPLKFVEYRTFDLPPDFRINPGAAIRILPTDDDKRHDFIANISIKLSTDRTLSVALGFVIDTTRYMDDVGRVARR